MYNDRLDSVFGALGIIVLDFSKDGTYSFVLIIFSIFSNSFFCFSIGWFHHLSKIRDFG